MKKLFLLLLLYNFVEAMNEPTKFDEYCKHEAAADLLKAQNKNDRTDEPTKQEYISHSSSFEISELLEKSKNILSLQNQTLIAGPLLSKSEIQKSILNQAHEDIETLLSIDRASQYSSGIWTKTFFIVDMLDIIWPEEFKTSFPYEEIKELINQWVQNNPMQYKKMFELSLGTNPQEAKIWQQKLKDMNKDITLASIMKNKLEEILQIIYTNHNLEHMSISKDSSYKNRKLKRSSIKTSVSFNKFLAKRREQAFKLLEAQNKDQKMNDLTQSNNEELLMYKA